MGLIVGLSGVDGSGKTTVARHVVDRLQRQGHKVTYHHELDFILLKPIFRLVSKLVGSRRAENVKEHTLSGAEQSKPLYSGMYYFLVWADNLISYLYFKLKRGIIVHDRWPYDIPAIFPYRHYKNRFIEKLLLSFPRPDILILLNVPPEVALLRKREDPLDWHQSLDFYESIGECISAIARKLKYDAVIDSNQPIDEVTRDVLAVVMNSKKKGVRRIMNAQDKKAEIDWWDRKGQSAYAETRWHEKFPQLVEHIEWHGLVLDAGCGIGGFTSEIMKLGGTVVGVDLSHKLLQVAKDTGGEFAAGDLENLSFGDETFDIVLCNMVLHHFPTIGEVPKELSRVLKEGGKLVIIEVTATFFAKGGRSLVKLIQKFHLKELKTPNETPHSIKEYTAVFKQYGLTNFSVTPIISATLAEELSSFRENPGMWSFVLLLRALLPKLFLYIPPFRSQAYDNVIICAEKNSSK